MSNYGTNTEIILGEYNPLQLKVPVIGILRGIEPELFGPLMQAAFAAGLQAIEVTMNTPGAEEIIGAHKKHVPAGKYWHGDHT